MWTQNEIYTVKEKRRCSKTIPPNTSWLGVLEDRLPASEDAVDGWTASTTGSVRKGFDFGMDSSTASAAEVKGSEWAEGETRRTGKKKRRNREKDYGKKEGEKS